MSDRFHASLEIGGPISPHLLPDLVSALQTCGLLYGADKITTFVNEQGVLRFEDDQAPYGQFPDLEDWLERNGIEFDRHSSGWFDTLPVSRHFRRDLGLVDKPRDGEGHALVVRDEVVKAMQAHTSLNDFRAALKRIVGPDIPPLQPVNLPLDPKKEHKP